MANQIPSSMGMNPGGKMAHMMSGNMSITFAIVILAICVVLMFHIVFTGWRKHKAVYERTGEHRILAHSLSMSLGMIASMSICIVVGAMMDAISSIAYIVGFIVGVIVGFNIGLPFRSLAMLDGVVAGVMGGLMGVMLGTMVPEPGIYTVSLLLVVLFSLTWFILFLRVYHSPKTTQQFTTNESSMDMG